MYQFVLTGDAVMGRYCQHQPKVKNANPWIRWFISIFQQKGNPL